MLRTTQVPLSALVSPFQAELGTLCQYNYDVEASEDRSSDEHYGGPAQSAKLTNSGPRPSGATSSQCRGVPRSAAVACASWVPSFLAATYFQPCERHRHHKKNECTFFCITCGVKPHSVCQHCMGAHAGHQVIQVRRYVYCDVVRACDISPYMDASGVQNYIINSAKVMFLNHRPHSKIGRANGVDICRTCHRHLREGYSYCSLACKVEALTGGETGSAAVGATVNGSPRPAAPEPRAPAQAPTAAAAAAAAAVAGASAVSRARPVGLSVPSLPDAAAGGGPVTFSPRTRTVFLSRAAAAMAAAVAVATAAAPPPSPGSPEFAAADASCTAALCSDPESSEPGEDAFAFCGAGSDGSGTSPLTARGSATVAAAARRRTMVVRDRDYSPYGSASSKEEDEQCYDYNFENPPKRRRSSHIVRRPSTSNGFSLPANGLPYAAASRGSSADLINAAAAAAADAEAAATAAATLLMPFRGTSCSILPAPPALSLSLPPRSFTAVSASDKAVAVGSGAGGVELSSLGGVGMCAVEAARTSSAPAVLSSRRKQHAPQRAPSC